MGAVGFFELAQDGADAEAVVMFQRQAAFEFDEAWIKTGPGLVRNLLPLVFEADAQGLATTALPDGFDDGVEIIIGGGFAREKPQQGRGEIPAMLGFFP